MCETCKAKQAHYCLPGESTKRFCGPCGKKHGAKYKGVLKMCETCNEKRPEFGIPPSTHRQWCGTCAPRHNAFNFMLKCIECGTRGPSHGTADQLTKHHHFRKRKWCAPCAAKRDDAVLIWWPCENCQVGKREYGFADEDFKRFCADCVDLHPGAA